MLFAPDSNQEWDDQGLFFALVLNFIFVTCFVSLVVFFHLCRVLWLRRLYRPNHTTTIIQTTSCNTESVFSSISLNSSPLNFNSNVKRVGRALSYPCSLFTFFNLRLWLSVEEKVPHMESILRTATTTAGDGEEERKEEVVSDEREVVHDSLTADVLAKTKTPIDPQIALYLAFLKFAASLTCLWSFFGLLLCVVSSSDTYLSDYIVQRDIHHCHRMDGNKTGCIDKVPFCKFFVVDNVLDVAKCIPVPIRGLYDLSTLNISPRSWRFWLVGLFDNFFCIIFILVVLFYIWRVNDYIQAVMSLQMQHAIGHRVAVVYGIDEKMLSEATFKKEFLEEQSYFDCARETTGEVVENNIEDSKIWSNEDHMNRIFNCRCLQFIFSIFGSDQYKINRKSLGFTKENCVQELIFPLSPVNGIFNCIKETESAIVSLQMAIADEKAHMEKEQKRYCQQENSDVNISQVPVDNDRDKRLLMRAPFPFCFKKVLQLDFKKQVFIQSASKLNECIDKIRLNPRKLAAFIIFSDAVSAYEFVTLFHLRQGVLSNARASIAGPADGIVHKNLSVNRYVMWLKSILVLFAFTALVLFWSVPIGFLSSVENLAQIPGIGRPIVESYRKTPQLVREIITSILPVLLLMLFEFFLPIIIRYFVIAMGAVNTCEVNCGMLFFQYLFMVLTGVIFQAALQGGFRQLGDILSDPSSEAIFNFFVALVSPQGGFWYVRVITAACCSSWLNLIDPFPLLIALLRHKFVSVQRAYDDFFKTCEFVLSGSYSFDLVIFSIALLFHTTAPFLTLFVAIFFFARYATQRCKLYDRYRPDVHPLYDCTLFCASAQVIRSVTMLYCLGSVGSVLFMGFRDHKGGVVLCSFSLMAAFILLFYVYIVTNCWANSLTNARRFAEQNKTKKMLHKKNFTVATTNNENNGSAKKKNSDCSDKANVEEGSMAQFCAPLIREENDINRDVVVNSVGGGGNTHNETGQCYFDGIFKNEAELLPQGKTISSSYQPKYQRLLHINIFDEISRLEKNVFYVNRYWNSKFQLIGELPDNRETGDFLMP